VVENAVDEPRRFDGAETPGQIYGFIEDGFHGLVLRVKEQLIRPHPQNTPVGGLHSRQTPVRGCRCESGVDLALMGESPIVEFKTVGRHFGVAEQSVARELLNRGARDRGRVLVPLEQELEGDFAGTGTVGHRVLVRKRDAVYLTELRPAPPSTTPRIVMPRYRVVVADFIVDELRPERDTLADIADLEMLNAHSEADLVGRIENADAIMLYHNIAITRATIGRLERCKLIVRCGVGYDNVDHRFARERGIPVANVPDYGTEEVADSAIGMMLTLTRGIAFLNNRLQREVGGWAYMQAAPLRRLRGRVFGIIGLGRIGTATALRAKALGMDVAFFDPYKQDGYDKALGVRRIEKLEDLLRQSFVVSVHCPLTTETRNLIDERAIDLMADGTYLVNTARGAVVDAAAIPGAIRSGKLAGAAIDVLPNEPPPAEHPLLVAWRDKNDPCHDRVIVNPHAAFYAEEGLLDMRVKGAQACRRALLGEPLRNVVN
jgi:C-terminal binding protein